MSDILRQRDELMELRLQIKGLETNLTELSSRLAQARDEVAALTLALGDDDAQANPSAT